MLTPFNILILIIAGCVLLWGFERYRTKFVKADLVIAIGLASGLVLLAVLPSVFDRIGTFLDIDNRFLIVSLLANVTLLSLVLYFGGLVRNVRQDLSELTRSLSVEQAPIADGGDETIAIVIPAYNEGETIRSVVKSLPERIRGYAIQPIVVSDGSSDGTAQHAKYNGATVVEHPINQGQGGALKTGFEIAIRDGAAIVVTMDGDGQHPPEELERLVAPVIHDEADYVMGSRYLGDNQSRNGIVRESGIRAFTVLINVLTKAGITDCTNGYRAIRGSMLEELTLTEERFSAPELIIEARKYGMRLKEIPITIEERQAGETKKPQLMYAVGLTRTILTAWIR